MSFHTLATALVASACLATAVLAAAPAPAASVRHEADKLRQLDIMLKVTGMHCSRTRADFTADYRRFSREHLASLSDARDAVRSAMVSRLGQQRGLDEYERRGTAIANRYGAGHPWLDCGQLRQVTRQLVEVQGRATLVEAADQLTGSRRAPRHAALFR